MITMYISNNRSSKHAEEFFDAYNIPVMQINIGSKFSREDIKSILVKNPDEIGSILALKSKNVKEIIKKFDELRLSELIDLIWKDPMLVKTPIIFDEHRFLAGYHSEDIRAFLPRNP